MGAPQVLNGQETEAQLGPEGHGLWTYEAVL